MRTKDDRAVDPGDTVYTILAGAICELTVKDSMAMVMHHYYGTLHAAADDLIKQIDDEISRLNERRTIYARIVIEARRGLGD